MTLLSVEEKPLPFEVGAFLVGGTIDEDGGVYEIGKDNADSSGSLES